MKLKFRTIHIILNIYIEDLDGCVVKNILMYICKIQLKNMNIKVVDKYPLIIIYKLIIYYLINIL